MAAVASGPVCSRGCLARARCLRERISYNTDEISSSTLLLFSLSLQILDKTRQFAFCFSLYPFLQAMIEVGNKSNICPSLTYTITVCQAMIYVVLNRLSILQQFCNAKLMQLYCDMKIIFCTQPVISFTRIITLI